MLSVQQVLNFKKIARVFCPLYVLVIKTAQDAVQKALRRSYPQHEF
jgi:hypothetical protein